jgi:hypothetical protein
MSWFRRVARIGLVALLLNAGLILVLSGNRFGAAFATSIVTADPARDAPPTAGDPDGPTGDIAPSTTGSIDDPGGPIKTPVRRYTTWSRLSAMLTWFRLSFVR